jgi:hypothetical protein
MQQGRQKSKPQVGQQQAGTGKGMQQKQKEPKKEDKRVIYKRKENQKSQPTGSEVEDAKQQDEKSPSAKRSRSPSADSNDAKSQQESNNGVIPMEVDVHPVAECPSPSSTRSVKSDTDKVPSLADLSDNDSDVISEADEHKPTGQNVAPPSPDGTESPLPGLMDENGELLAEKEQLQSSEQNA